MPYTDKFYEDSEMTQIPPAGYVVIFNGYSEGVSTGQKVLRMLNSEGVFSNVSSGSVGGGSGLTFGSAGPEYSASQQYTNNPEEGANCCTNQECLWLYINASPSTGNAPPSLPTTSNDYWKLIVSKGDTGPQGPQGVSGIVLGIIKAYNPGTGTATVQEANDDWTENPAGTIHENVVVP